MYTYTRRVSYSDCNHTGRPRLANIVDYLQDASTFQSEEAGVGVDFLWAHNSAWVLASWQLDLDRLPTIGEEIKVWTNPYSVKGFFGERNYMLSGMDDAFYLRGNSIWMYVDLTTGRPKRVDPEMFTAYERGEPIEMEYLDRKFDMPSDLEEKECIRAPKLFLDTNQHVNNAKYLALAEEYIPDDFIPRRIRTEYKAPARYGDVMRPFIKLEENAFYASIRGEDDIVYCNMIIEK